ncbi:hypothetical protein F5X96DRAFT_660439 [Biscogniauxia mediterranea]|nr:hypothetical protein F5X96DRAFT_660439 [Biscogniauxia mediterranea]
MLESPGHFPAFPKEGTKRGDTAAVLATEEQQNMAIIIFNLLPMSVQSRLPALQSLRRPASLSILSSRRRKSTHRTKSDDEEEVAVSGDDDSTMVEVPPRAPEGVADPSVIDDETPVLPVPVPEEKTAPIISSGIKWRYATQGSYLHHSAAREKEDPGFARRAYIDGVAYMLKSLPDDLDDHETSVIRQALPSSCAAPAAGSAIGGDGAGFAGPGDQQQRTIGWRPSDQGKTLLHRAVAAVVSSLVVLLHVLMSCAVLLVRAGAQYERQYSISQHIVSRGFVFATAVGRHSVVLSGKICAMSDGRVGRAMTDLAAWTVENLTSGFQDGIGQGIWAIEQKRK